jgi:hypothetical protein
LLDYPRKTVHDSSHTLNIKPINTAGYVCRITEFKEVPFHQRASGQNINMCIFSGAPYISQKLLGPKQTLFAA